MNSTHIKTLGTVVANDQAGLLEEWTQQQFANDGAMGTLTEAEVREQSREFLQLVQSASRSEASADTRSPEWTPVFDFLTEISRRRARQGVSSADTARFVFSLKQPLFKRLGQYFKNDPEALAAQVLQTSLLFDELGLFTTGVYQKAREEVISRQQQEMLELSTPVVKLWDGILALPLIGTLDSERTQVVMESLLQEIVNSNADIAIIEITGVPTVDTLVAQHLLKTVAAARLMGADCIISGIRPQIAQTIVHLGVELNDVVTKATLADAFKLALQRKGLAVTAQPRPAGR